MPHASPRMPVAETIRNFPHMAGLGSDVKHRRAHGQDVVNFTRMHQAQHGVAHVKPVKHPQATATTEAVDEKKLQELNREIMDLKIANRGKDYLIDQLKGERAGFFEKLLSANRTVGQMETKLQQLDGLIKLNVQ